MPANRISARVKPTALPKPNSSDSSRSCAQADVEQRHAEHRAVGGDQRQVDAQHLVQHRAGLLDHQFGELHDGGDGDDEGQRAQVFELVGHQQPAVDQVAGAAGHGEHEGGRRAHAERGLQLLRHAHERAQAEDADEDDVVDENRAENDEEVAGHDARSVPLRVRNLPGMKLSAFACASAIRRSSNFSLRRRCRSLDAFG
jgi:hypothetical protein